MLCSKLNRKIRAIFFDAGGTLLRVHPSVGEVYSRTAKKYGCSAEPKKIQKLFWHEFNAKNIPSLRKAHCSEKNEKKWWKSVVSEVFSHFPPIKNFDAFFEELYEIFASPIVWRLYPEVQSVLKKLKKDGYILGVVSNWDSRLIKILEGLKLRKTFDLIVISALVGTAKPDPKIFKIALKKAGVKPEEALHIGDRYQDDYFGAKSAGIIPVLLSRNGNYHARARTICSLTKLFTLC